MADEWWSTSVRMTGDDGASACSTVPVTGQDAAESAATSATSTDYFRPADGAAAASPPSSFLTDPRSTPHMVDWTQAYMSAGGGGRAAASFYDALLQHRGDDAGRRFLLEQQPDAVDDGAAPSASLYADNMYSSYGDVPAAPPMTTKPFSQQHFSAGFFGSSARNFSGVPSAPPPITAKPLLLQALEHKDFKSHMENVQDSCSSSTRRSVPDSPLTPAAKKPRIATPSPLPIFKVRKEKLGDRITALQQLVSPFGKTDTASVLHEAIEYIRFLHDQVASLSSPYLRCRRPVQVQQLHQQEAKDIDDEAKEDLRSRGLCLVPVASTYAVAGETAPEFWHPSFGGTYR